MSLLCLIELVGTAVFAISGALAGIRMMSTGDLTRALSGGQ